MKLKGNRLLFLCSAIALTLPAILVVNVEADAIGWVYRLQFLCQFFLYPILSSFVITFLIQKEYADQTIINSLTAPVARMTFLGAKLAVWLIWYLLITFGFWVIVSVRITLVFDVETLLESWGTITAMILKTGILYFCAMSPIAWIAVMQRKMFYLSLLAAFLMSSAGFAGLLTHGMMGSIVPWFAVMLLNMPNGDVVASVAYASIGTCSAVGFGLAACSFQMQEL
jgi:ABC-type transport system involved in multi-copper enzyme maturation permease subunit